MSGVEIGILVIVAANLLLAAAVVYSFVSAARRRRALLAVAGKLGLAFDSGRDAFKSFRIYVRAPEPATSLCLELPKRYEAATICSKGDFRDATNVVTGEFERARVTYFDYCYTYAGKGSTNHRYSVCAAESSLCRRLIVKPVTLLDKAAALVRLDPIKDDAGLDNSEFQGKSHVWSEDREFACVVLSRQVAEFFIARPGISMEMLANAIVFYRRGRISPDAVEALIRDAASFVAMLPDSLRADSQAAPPSRPA